MTKDLARTNGSCPDQVDDFELPGLDELFGPVIAGFARAFSEDLPAAGPARESLEEAGRSFYSELLTQGVELHRPARRRRFRPRRR